MRHTIPGRLRVVFPDLVCDQDRIALIAAYISSASGITKTGTNHYSGSVTIFYNPDTTTQDDILNELMCFDAEKILDMDSAFPDAIRDKGADGPPPKGEKAVWNTAGKILGGAGTVALFVPLCPGIPMLMAAAYCKIKANGTTT